MSGDTTIQALKRLTFLPERDPSDNGHLIAGQEYDDVYFEGGEGNNLTLNDPIINDAIIPQLKEEYFASIITYGAVGDGTTDCYAAITNALAENNAVYIPQGTFRVSATIEVASGKRLFGSGNTSILQADNTTYDVIKIPNGFAQLANFKTFRGDAGIRLFGRDGPCIDNSVVDILIENCNYGIILDGYNNTNNPCYWNNFERITIRRPNTHGVWLTKSGAGDTPNANKFNNIRIHSLSTNITGSGIYVEYGAFSNAFFNPYVDLTTTAHSCIRLGAQSNMTILVNPYTETNGGVSNIRMEAGSQKTTIYNLLSASAGSAISDASGGDYSAYNSGFPIKNRFKETSISDLTLNTTRYNTLFITGETTYTPDFSVPYYLISDFSGDVALTLPNADDAPNITVTFVKSNLSDNKITITEDSGLGPNARSWILSQQYDTITLVSNGAVWFVQSTNLFPITNFFYDGGGTFSPDLSRNLYLVSAFVGATSVVLPNANDDNIVGRVITIKKSDVSTNAVTITESGGSGIDGATVTLSDQYDSVTFVSNGASYFKTSEVIAGSMTSWGLTGNSGTSAGTNFVGTSDSTSLVFKTNSTESYRVDTSQRLLLGNTTSITTNSQTPKLQIAGIDSNNSNAAVYRFSANNVQSRFVLNKSRNGTIGNHTTLNSGDAIGSIDFNGSNGTTFNASSQIIAEADAAFSGSNSSGRIRLLTATTAGTLTEGVRLDSKQNFVVGTAALSTSATDGFPYIPTCNGTPVGTPTSYTGRAPLIINSANNRLYLYNSGWQVIGGVFVTSYDSGNQTITAGGLLSLTHGLGSIPKLIVLELVCVTNDLGFTAGDVLEVDKSTINANSAGGNYGCAVTKTATQIFVRYSNTAGVFSLFNGGTGAAGGVITPANWALVVKAYA